MVYFFSTELGLKEGWYTEYCACQAGHHACAWQLYQGMQVTLRDVGPCAWFNVTSGKCDFPCSPNAASPVIRAAASLITHPCSSLLLRGRLSTLIVNRAEIQRTFKASTSSQRMKGGTSQLITSSTCHCPLAPAPAMAGSTTTRQHHRPPFSIHPGHNLFLAQV